MKKLDVRELIEVRESLEAHELKERINKILRMFEEDEAFEVIDHGKVIAHVVPVSEPKKTREQEIKAFWADMDQLAAEIGAHWKGNMSAVDAVRDVRRDL